MEMRTIEMTNADLLAVLCGPAGRALSARPLSEIFGIRSARQTSFIAGEERTSYEAQPQIAAAKELYIRAMQEDMSSTGIDLASPSAASTFLCGRIGGYEHEVFMCLWMDARNRLIVAEELFRGTLTQTSVYPREVVKRALVHNAAAVILAHNHPSGEADQSRADEVLTTSLKAALALVDVKVLDHFIVAGNKTLSFAERGLLWKAASSPSGRNWFRWSISTSAGCSSRTSRIRTAERCFHSRMRTETPAGRVKTVCGLSRTASCGTGAIPAGFWSI